MISSGKGGALCNASLGNDKPSPFARRKRRYKFLARDKHQVSIFQSDYLRVYLSMPNQS
jgi:hypothetical protein